MTTALAPVAQQRLADLTALMKRKTNYIAGILAPGMSADLLVRRTLAAVARQPAILECSAISILQSVALAGRLGLECDGTLNQAWLVPFAGKCTLVPGYEGLRDLCVRSGRVKRIWSEIVRRGDLFEWAAWPASLVHRPGVNEHALGDDDYDTETGDPLPTHAYAVAVLDDGAEAYVVESWRKILAFRARYGNKSGPWFKHGSHGLEAMARKTAIRQLAKRLPKSVEVAAAVALAGEHEEAMDEAAHTLDLDPADVTVKGDEPAEVAPEPTATQRLADRLAPVAAPPKRATKTIDVLVASTNEHGGEAGGAPVSAAAERQPPERLAPVSPAPPPPADLLASAPARSTEWARCILVAISAGGSTPREAAQACGLPDESACDRDDYERVRVWLDAGGKLAAHVSLDGAPATEDPPPPVTITLASQKAADGEPPAGRPAESAATLSAGASPATLTGAASDGWTVRTARTIAPCFVCGEPLKLGAPYRHRYEKKGEGRGRGELKRHDGCADPLDDDGDEEDGDDGAAPNRAAIALALARQRLISQPGVDGLAPGYCGGVSVIDPATGEILVRLDSLHDIAVWLEDREERLAIQGEASAS